MERYFPRQAPIVRCKNQVSTLYGTGIVRAASATFVIQPVKRCSSLLLAIITQDFLHMKGQLSNETLSVLLETNEK